MGSFLSLRHLFVHRSLNIPMFASFCLFVVHALGSVEKRHSETSSLSLLLSLLLLLALFIHYIIQQFIDYTPTSVHVPHPTPPTLELLQRTHRKTSERMGRAHRAFQCFIVHTVSWSELDFLIHTFTQSNNKQTTVKITNYKMLQHLFLHLAFFGFVFVYLFVFLAGNSFVHFQ